MPPRPFHRWKSLWLGLLVLALLGYGWVRSMSYTDGFFWFPEWFAFSGYQSTGQIGFSWDQSRLRTTVFTFDWIHEPISSAGEPWFPRPVVPEVYNRQFQFAVASLVSDAVSSRGVGSSSGESDEAAWENCQYNFP